MVPALLAVSLLVANASGPRPDTPAVYGGVAVQDCGWPTTLHAQSCTATLVHERVAVLAAHCPDPADVFLGQRIQHRAEPDLGRTVPVEHCLSHPEYLGSESLGDGVDIKFCVLAKSVTDVPVVPILMGCETGVLAPGKDVTIVGFGIQDIGMTGYKVEVTAPINEISATGEVDIGGDGKDSCNGDSGGPVYVKLTAAEGFDDTWRVFGVTSYGKGIGINSCGKGGYYTQMSVHVPWIEEESGIDITPCHDGDGTWNPGPGCVTRFPRMPDTGDGAWNACAWPQEGDEAPSRTCGSPFDVVAPQVAILGPLDGTSVETAFGQPAVVAVDVDASDVDGSGIAAVELTVETLDGELVSVQAVSSWPEQLAPLELDPGDYALRATATDARGNGANAVPVTIAVVEVAGTSDGDGTDGETGDTTDGSGETDGAGEGETGARDGCGCRQSPRQRGGWAALALLYLARRRVTA